MMDQFMSPEEYQQEIRRLHQLVEVSVVINSTLELRSLLSIIMDHVADITGAEQASVLLYDNNTDQLRFVATSTSTASTVQNELLNIPVPMEGSLAGTILRKNQPIMRDDLSDDPLHFRDADAQSGFETRSLLGVPMHFRDEPIGVLESVNKKEGGWTEEDRRNMLVLASQAAVAIRNAQMVEQLQSAYDELDQLDKLKNDFIAIASHELRTPLSVILGYATFLKEDAQGEVSAHASAVLNSALRMRNLIEDMTNLRYLKLGEAELSKEHIPLTAIFQAAQGDVEDMAEAKNHALEVQMPDMGLIVVVDRIKLGMALTNLLYNGIKFTPSGGKISLGFERKPHAIWLSVTDTGVGIPQDQLERIFEEFHQVEDHMTRRHGGMGLGLSIARALIEAHNGRLWAESDGAGLGSTFYISLPYDG